jgi:hypothetical protein
MMGARGPRSIFWMRTFSVPPGEASSMLAAILELAYHPFEFNPRREIRTECGDGGIAWNS